ncbi:MAG: metalloregulator ArsR/SmtB family transcription factor [Roseibium sp.]|uniref:ArsR/SmtB family transcription factor n=1 Tax=Roseibium sp. TaxID=1936156 RepID=UPI00263625E1|nr:metalloregulator ArsR/SmtB family transcription factor [Roseibium sp.]MCV0429667.1 metalloregulator ArsR/SmtB family transcription factor [Roseibium sp.]
MLDDEKLTDILKAVSDPRRRELLTLLVQHGPTRVTDLAKHFDISLNAVSKHIKILEAAGLVRRRTEWREHLIEPDMGPVSEIDRWFQELRSIWAKRLDALDEMLSRETGDE